jgi:DNA-binding NarL/FixJ family response regulator
MPSKDDIRILLVDDHAMVREALSRILGESSRIKVAGQAGDGQSALKMARELRPDMVVMDYSMPGMDALDILARLRQDHPKIKVLILTVHDNPHYAIKSLQAGAHGFVIKSAAVRELVAAITAVHTGGLYVPPELSDKVFNHLWGTSKRRVGVEALTQREFTLLRCLGSGKSLKECARCLGISGSATATYRSRLLGKLELENTGEIIRFALENRLVV